MTRLKRYSGVLGEGVTFLFGLGVKSVDEILKLRVKFWRLGLKLRTVYLK